MAEWPRGRLNEVFQEAFLRIHRNGTGIDLRKVQNTLMRFRRSVPAPWIVRANSTCFGNRFPSGFSESCCPNINMLLSGVRSSCDMFAKKTRIVLRCECKFGRLVLECASCLFDLLIFAFNLDVAFGELLSLLFELFVSLLQLLLLKFAIRLRAAAIA